MKKTGRKSEPDLHRQKSGKLVKKRISKKVSQNFKAEAELKESEERYRLLFENSGEAILLTNPDGSIYSANPAACRMYGRTGDEICKIGRNGIIDLNDPRLESAINERNKTGKFKGELNQVKKDGTIFPAEVNSIVYRDTSGNERTNTIIRDISERGKAEEALAESKTILTSIIDSTNDLIWSVDPDQFKLLTFNKALEVFLKKEGIHIEKGMLLDEILPDESVKKLQHLYSQTLQAGSVITDYQTTIGNRTLLINLHLLSNEGRPFAISVFAKDVTDQKITEEDLKQSLDWQKAIFNGSRDAIFISDQDSRFVAVNKAAADLTGYPLEMLVKMRITDIHDIDDLNAYRMYHRRIFGGEEILSEAKILRSNGQKIDAEFNNRLIFVSGKQYMHTTARDITERKQADEALRLEKENFRRSLDDSPLGVRIVTAQGNTIYANQAILNIYGYDSLEEFQKTPLKKRYTPESYAEAQKRKQQRNHGDLSTTNYEISIVRKNGEIRHLQVFREKVLWNNSWLFQVIWNDITERRQAEERLGKLNECFLKFGTDTLSNINLLVALCGEVMGGMCSLYNRLQGDMLCPLGQWNTPPNFRSIDHPEGYLCNEVLNSTGETAIIVIRDLQNTSYALTDPNVLMYHLNTYIGKAVKSNNINIGSLCVMFQRDVIPSDNDLRFMEIIASAIGIEEARKQTEEALRESEARFRNLFENSLLGISIVNPDARLILANMAYAKMFGYNNPEEILAEVSDVSQLYVNPEERKEVLQSFSRDGFMEPKEFELKRRDGSSFFVMVSISQIRGSDGKLLYNQATHIDLTERRKMESELRNSKELLEKLNQHLIEVREDERAGISREIHDELGQSLTALKLDLNRLYKYVNSNPEAVTQLDSMIELISDTIKDVQRISSDLRPGILDELGLVSAIEWYCDEFEIRTGIKCNLKLDDSDYNNSYINLTFFRVLQETLTNVIRHARASSVKVILQQTNQGATLTIQDNGIGISREEIVSNKSLGLISMYERVKQFNGKIEISSKKGDGTKLTVFIPS